MSGFDWESLKSREQVTAFVSSVDRAQLILDNAAGSGSLEPSKIVDSNKGLDTLRLAFQCGSNPVLSRLKRSSGLVKYLCGIVTFKTPLHEEGGAALDAQVGEMCVDVWVWEGGVCASVRKCVCVGMHVWVGVYACVGVGVYACLKVMRETIPLGAWT